MTALPPPNGLVPIRPVVTAAAVRALGRRHASWRRQVFAAPALRPLSTAPSEDAATPPVPRVLRRLFVNRIAATAARLADVDASAITGSSRNARLVLARHAAICVAREMTGASSPVLARLFGRRHHSTVLYALKRGRRDRALIAAIVALRTALAGEAR